MPLSTCFPQAILTYPTWNSTPISTRFGSGSNATILRTLPSSGLPRWADELPVVASYAHGGALARLPPLLVCLVADEVKASEPGVQIEKRQRAHACVPCFFMFFPYVDTDTNNICHST
eukprot:scaffold219005_cov32-Tisochrysis_lutea.AAC.3